MFDVCYILDTISIVGVVNSLPGQGPGRPQFNQPQPGGAVPPHPQTGQAPPHPQGGPIPPQPQGYVDPQGLPPPGVQNMQPPPPGQGAPPPNHQGVPPQGSVAQLISFD